MRKPSSKDSCAKHRKGFWHVPVGCWPSFFWDLLLCIQPPGATGFVTGFVTVPRVASFPWFLSVKPGTGAGGAAFLHASYHVERKKCCSCWNPFLYIPLKLLESCPLLKLSSLHLWEAAIPLNDMDKHSLFKVLHVQNLLNPQSFKLIYRKEATGKWISYCWSFAWFLQKQAEL